MAFGKIVGWLLTFGCLLLSIENPVWSAEPITNPSNASNTVAKEPDVILSLLDTDDKPTVWQGLRLQVSVISGSAPGGIGVDSLKISWPSRLALRDPGRLAGDTHAERVLEKFILVAGARRDLEPVELASIFVKDLGTSIFPILLYRPRKEAITATLEYKDLAMDVTESKSVRLMIPVKAHPLGMLLAPAEN